MKQTPLLLAVKAILMEAKQPVSVPALTEALEQQHLTPNKTTLYRLLDRLQEAGEVETVLLDSQVTFYELKRHHHHHFVCEGCDQIECLADPALEQHIHQLEHFLESNGRRVTHHEFSFKGLCAQCV